MQESPKGTRAPRRAAHDVWTAVPPERAFAVIEGLGGERGWYGVGFLWQLRGALDRLVGGPGMRRGRRDPDRLAVGDPLDFWRVEAIERPRRLLLRAQMRLPGRTTLEFEVRPERGGSRITQSAEFAPSSHWGLAYWYAIYPLHGLVFGAMLRGIAKAAEADTQAAREDSNPA